MRPYELRVKNEAADVITDSARKSVQLTGEKLKHFQRQSCEWCGISFRNTFDCIESMKDEVFDCESNHGPFCRECWEEFSHQCIHCNCTKCGIQLSQFIESFEDISYEIHNCHNDHGPFCYQCWKESSNKCPETINNNCAPKPRIQWAKCGNCGHTSSVTNSVCGGCAIVLGKCTDEVFELIIDETRFDDNLRVLQAEDYINIHMYFWCMVCAFYCLSEFNPHWSSERIGIYLVSFLTGIIFWPFIGNFSHFFLRSYCNFKGYELINSRQLSRFERDPMMYSWGEDHVSRKTVDAINPTKIQKLKWKYFSKMEGEWRGICFSSTLLSGIIVLLSLSIMIPYLVELY